MYKAVLLLLTLAAFVFATESVQDQEGAEQIFLPWSYPYGLVSTYPGYGYPYGFNYYPHRVPSPTVRATPKYRIRSDLISRVIGKYCTTEMNIEEYLNAIALSTSSATTTRNAHNCVDLQINDDEWNVQSEVLNFKFRPGVKTNRVTLDGRHVTSLFDVEETADKVIVWQIETWGDNKFGSQIVHELDGRHWNLTLTFGDVDFVTVATGSIFLQHE